MEIPLFKKYPKLKNKISYISLGLFPTPIKKFNKLNDFFDFDGLYIKRDDLSGQIYGGNKVRKLEFILGHAKKLKKKTVITFGLAGSNHVLATIIYAKSLGFNAVGMLLPQENSNFLRKNILADVHYGGDIYESKNKFLLAIKLIFVIIKYFLKDKKIPYIIVPGGSSEKGNVGYVNAAFEINEQISSGAMPKPKIIYVPMGSSGTVAGLILGFKLLNLDIKVCGIRVSDKQYVNEKRLLKLIKKTNLFLHSIDEEISIVEVNSDDYYLNENYFSPGYGIFNNDSVAAINLFYKNTGILLDGTYTGKTFVAVRDDIIKQKNTIILFWNTYNSRKVDLGNKKFNDYDIPKNMKRYYINPVQILDNEIMYNLYVEN